MGSPPALDDIVRCGALAIPQSIKRARREVQGYAAAAAALKVDYVYIIKGVSYDDI